jgi:signal transduction histidine kinase
MVVTGRRKTIAGFIVLGACLTALAFTQYLGWVFNWRTGLVLVLGVLFTLAIAGGIALNTIFLVREIRRNEQHDAFINAVTHELKTPVASIRLYLETLRSREIDEARRDAFYDIMLEDTGRLMGTIEQVLRAGRVARARRLSHAPVDLVPLAQEAVEVARTRRHLPPEAIEYRAASGCERAIVMGDADELHAAVSNLLDNAIKYSGEDVRVTLALEPLDEGTVAVRVTDSGMGIPPHELKRIFKRFYRIPGPARIKGTGLGLFIVRSVARRHGGDAFAESGGPGRGSTFTLRLPIAK